MMRARQSRQWSSFGVGHPASDCDRTKAKEGGADSGAGAFESGAEAGVPDPGEGGHDRGVNGQW